jgi:hypothetical protein
LPIYLFNFCQHPYDNSLQTAKIYELKNLKFKGSQFYSRTSSGV